MQGGKIRMMQKILTGTYTGFTVMAIATVFLIGCAAGGKNAADKHLENAKPLISALENGEGFSIKEFSKMDEASRKDFNNAVIMIEDENYEQAVELLQGVIEKSPGVTAPYINMAIACQGIGKQEKAEDNLKTALNLFPDHPVVCNEYGLLYRKTGRFAEAKKMYEKAINRFPDYNPAHRNMGILCDLYLNDPDCALRHYEIYSKAKPQDKQVKVWIAGLRLAAERN